MPDDGNSWNATLKRYAIALLLLLAAIAVSRALNPWTAPHTTPPYFTAVMLAAVFGGAGPGLLTTFGSSLAIAWFDLGSTGLFGLGIDDAVRLATFVAAALILSYVSAARKSAERELRLALERLAAADRAKDEFIATLSHELRTPLTGILGWLQILREADIDDETRETALRSIEQSARTQQMLVNDVLDVSRIVLGKLEIRREPVLLQEVIRQAIDVVRPEANARNVEIACEAARESLVIDGDADRLKQVIWNFLTNGVKFTPPGGSVRVALRRDETRAVIQVSDNGEGIAPEHLPHIFDRFRQAMSGHKGGLGLGLAIVEHIVTLHGGTVAAYSEGRGRGSTFIARLPLLLHTE